MLLGLWLCPKWYASVSIPKRSRLIMQCTNLDNGCFALLRSDNVIKPARCTNISANHGGMLGKIPFSQFIFQAEVMIFDIFLFEFKAKQFTGCTSFLCRKLLLWQVTPADDRESSPLCIKLISKSGKVQLAELTKKLVSHPRPGLWEMRIRSDPSSKSSCGTIHSEGHNWTGSTSANPKLFYTPIMFINTIQFPLWTRSDFHTGCTSDKSELNIWERLTDLVPTAPNQIFFCE